MSKLSQINPATYYPITLPSTKEQIYFRAYNVKEEKQLLFAEQSENGVTMLQTLVQVVNACLKPEQKNITTFDLEYLFANIRSKSVGEFASLKLGCSDCPEVAIDYKYPLEQIKVEYPAVDKSLVKINSMLAFKMRYPTISESIQLELITDEVQKKFKAVSSCIVEVYNDNEVIPVTDQEDDKLAIVELLDKLLPQEYQMLADFFDSMPFVYGKIDYRCPKCKKEHSITIKGLSSFFE